MSAVDEIRSELSGNTNFDEAHGAVQVTYHLESRNKGLRGSSFLDWIKPTTF